MNELFSIIQRIEAGRLLSYATFNFDIVEALDQRDQPDFDAAWMRVQVAIQALATPKEFQGSLERLRETAFAKTIDITECSELAGYVSDDFELLGTALLSGFNDDWLNAVWLEYWNHRFPRGKLLPVEGTLREVFE